MLHTLNKKLENIKDPEKKQTINKLNQIKKNLQNQLVAIEKKMTTMPKNINDIIITLNDFKHRIERYEQLIKLEASVNKKQLDVEIENNFNTLKGLYIQIENFPETENDELNTLKSFMNIKLTKITEEWDTICSNENIKSLFKSLKKLINDYEEIEKFQKNLKKLNLDDNQKNQVIKHFDELKNFHEKINKLSDTENEGLKKMKNNMEEQLSLIKIELENFLSNKIENFDNVDKNIKMIFEVLNKQINLYKDGISKVGNTTDSQKESRLGLFSSLSRSKISVESTDQKKILSSDLSLKNVRNT